MSSTTDNSRGACVPVFRDVDSVFAGNCCRLEGGAKIVPGAPVFSLTVTNVPTDIWQDEFSNRWVTSDAGEFYEML